MVRYLRTAEAKEQLLKVGSETIGSAPEALTAAVKADMERLGRVIREAGLKLD